MPLRTLRWLSLPRRLVFRFGALSHVAPEGIGVDESRLVWKLLRHGPRDRVMVDVGAHHGGSLEPFARRGWSVFAFEPDSRNRALLVPRTNNYLNVHVDPRAVSDEDAAGLTLFRSDVSSGISTLARFHGSHAPAEQVNTVTLRSFLKEKGDPHVTFLKIDAEGFDLQVLRGYPWERDRPDVIVCEFEDRKTRAFGYNFHDLAGFLHQAGYYILVSEWHPVLEYGRQHRHRRFTKYPAQPKDPDAWGNLIGVRSKWLFVRASLLSTLTIAVGQLLRRLMPGRQP